MTVPVIGLDIGGSKLAAALIDDAGEIVAREQAVSPAAEGPEAMVAAAGALVNFLVAAAGRRPKLPRPVAVGVATAGVVDPGEGVIRSAVDTIKGWAGVPLARRLEELTGLPVAVENDVNAMGLAETSRGAAHGARSALIVAVGTGIGGALLLDGQLWRGRTGSAGEIGHIYITPTMEHARAVAEAGADIVAIDGTGRARPDDRDLMSVIRLLHTELGAVVLADVGTVAEGVAAAACGADAVATTLAGLTGEPLGQDGPALDTVAALAARLDVPVIAEGGITSPAQAREALEAGAWCVVVGKAITSPDWITARYVESMDGRAALAQEVVASGQAESSQT